MDTFTVSIDWWGKIESQDDEESFGHWDWALTAEASRVPAVGEWYTIGHNLRKIVDVGWFEPSGAREGRHELIAYVKVEGADESLLSAAELRSAGFDFPPRRLRGGELQSDASPTEPER